jgi:hypothetical protein
MPSGAGLAMVDALGIGTAACGVSRQLAPLARLSPGPARTAETRDSRQDPRGLLSVGIVLALGVGRDTTGETRWDAYSWA